MIDNYAAHRHQNIRDRLAGTSDHTPFVWTKTADRILNNAKRDPASIRGTRIVLVRLLSAVLGFLLRKAGAFAGIILTLFLVFVVIQAVVPALREAVTDRERLRQVTVERVALEDELKQLQRAAAEGQSEAIESLKGSIDAEIEEGRRKASEKRDEIERLRDDQAEIWLS